MASPTTQSSSSFKKPVLSAIAAVVLSYVLLKVPFFPDLETVVISHPAPPPLEGPFARNALLDEARKLAPELPGAECVVPVGDSLVTGLLDGRLVRVQDDRVHVLLGCEAGEARARPLGLRFDNRTKELYVADEARGLFKLNLESGKRTLLHAASLPLAGHPSLLTDDLTVAQGGDIYFTDASTKWGFHHLHLDFAEGSPNGRILHFHPRTNATQLLLNHLHFPNGIQLSPDEDYLLYCETSRFRIMKYYLRGPRQGQLEVFVDNLPGYPDNIRVSERGTYWVGLPMLRMAGRSSIAERLGPYPQLRKALVRLPYLAALLFRVPDALGLTRGVYDRARQAVSWFLSEYGGGPVFGCVMEVDREGQVLRSLQASKAKIQRLSTGLEHKGVLYLGSPWEEGLYALKLTG